jgi:hypothetical protein
MHHLGKIKLSFQAPFPTDQNPCVFSVDFEIAGANSPICDACLLLPCFVSLKPQFNGSKYTSKGKNYPYFTAFLSRIQNVGGGDPIETASDASVSP